MNSVLVPTIICPGCHAELEFHRETCPYCKSPLRIEPTGLPPPSTLLGQPRPALDNPWVITVLLLHVGFLGIPMYWKSNYSVRTRLIICLISVLYTLFAVGFILVVGGWLLRTFTRA